MSLDDLVVNTEGWALEDDAPVVRILGNQLGDVLALHFFDLAPDIAAPLDDLAALRAAYRDNLLAAGAGLVQCDVVRAAGVPAVLLVAKIPQEPRGMAYLGSLTLPFRDASWVVKVQCLEGEITGLRDSALFMKWMSEHPDAMGDEGPVGWFADPYEPARNDPIMRNDSEAPEHDAQFPEHPLSRARRYLAHFQRTLSAGAGMRARRPF